MCSCTHSARALDARFSLWTELLLLFIQAALKDAACQERCHTQAYLLFHLCSRSLDKHPASSSEDLVEGPFKNLFAFDNLAFKCMQIGPRRFVFQ